MTMQLDGYLRIGKGDLPPNKMDTLCYRYTYDWREGVFEAWKYDEESEVYLFPWAALDDVRSMVDLDEVSLEVCLSNGRPILHLTESKLVPRKGQEETITSTLDALVRYNHCLLVAGCGMGKTVMGAEVSLRIGCSTCVLVHKEFLAKQWEDAYRMLDPGVIIGRMQRDRCDTGETHDVVIATTQSVTNARREYPEEFYRSFGLVIGDEVHRYAADVWQTAITKFSANFRLGLTATDHRSDGLWSVVTDHFGSRKVQLVGESLKPLIYAIRTTATSSVKKMPWLDDTQMRAKLITELTSDEGRNAVVYRNLKKAIKAGRKILVISERRKQLDIFAEWMKDSGFKNYGKYVGGKKQHLLDKAAEKQVVLTTYQMAKEGLDIPELDVLIMASPQAHIQQTVGRIVRPREGKRRPVVLDFIDEQIEGVGGFWYSRRKEYRKLGYEIEGE